jgi:hypothetical protein
MSNPYGRLGAPMIQPTKDEIRQWLYEARRDASLQRSLREIAEYKLELAKRKLGMLVLQGKIEIPVEKLGEMVLELPEPAEVETENAVPMLENRF